MAAKSDNTNEVLDMVKDLASNQCQANQALSNTLKDMIPKIGNYNNNPYPLLNLQITLAKQYAKTVGVIRCILI